MMYTLGLMLCPSLSSSLTHTLPLCVCLSISRSVSLSHTHTRTLPSHTRASQKSTTKGSALNIAVATAAMYSTKTTGIYINARLCKRKDRVPYDVSEKRDREAKDT